MLSVTLKLATPLLLLVALAGLILEWPVPWLSVTVLPPTGLPLLSFSVTVSVAAVVPLAAILVGLALSVEVLAEATGVSVGIDAVVVVTIVNDALADCDPTTAPTV